jgi:hypothetical protein
MTELFEKVFIKTEDDLPKVKTACYFHDKVMGNVTLYHCPSTVNVMNHFINECDWYLRPLKMEGMYEREFVEWLLVKDLSYSNQKFYQDSDGGVKQFTLDELYLYWQNNVKDK